MATKTLMTLEEFDRLPDDGLKHELNKGELVTMTLPMPRHSDVIQNIYDILKAFLRQHPLGKLWFPDTPFVLSLLGEPTTLRGPDLAYMSNERAAQIDPHRRIQGAAELTIEVVSPSDSPKELLEKTAQYLGAGGHTVWIVYRDEREVRIFEASGSMRILRVGDNIDAPQLLPGFSAPVASFFE
jgi:Uma2 family endonuclease